MRRIAASIIFFTRLPLWRVCNLDKKYYERVVPLWPMVGWLTGGMMVGVFCLASMVLPIGLSVAMALVSRLLLTGALPEDGFADFCDGFGGGTSRQRILEIMKDSHIGTYGVLGLVLYYLILWQTLTALLSSGISPFVLLLVDTYAKYLSSTIVYFLPYARSEAEAKNKLIYQQTPFSEKLLSMVLGVLPLAVMLIIGVLSDNLVLSSQHLILLIPMIAPIICCALLFAMMKRSIQGYTGDCCGATFIISELVCYVALLVVR